MDLTPGQQRLVFAVVVLGFAGLAIYLVTGRGSGGTPAASPSPSASSAQPSNGGTANGVPPATVPPPAPVSTAGGAEIYQWLPFTPADLTAAVSTTTTFAKEYATWSYTEDAAAYAAKLSGLATATEATALQANYSTPGQAALRKATKQVSTGTGTIDTIRAFGAGSITFTVTINQQLASTQPTKTTNNQYVVTVVSGSGGWQVNDIELAKLGNV
jgi:hypothetical protein